MASPGDAKFLAWEREAKAWRDRSNERGKTDGETDACLDRELHFLTLIAHTPAAGLTGARVKAAFLLQQFEDFDRDDAYWANRAQGAALRTIVEALSGAA
jgi:hypothetical protein